VELEVRRWTGKLIFFELIYNLKTLLNHLDENIMHGQLDKAVIFVLHIGITIQLFSQTR
jgi:hypothetical protein